MKQVDHFERSYYDRTDEIMAWFQEIEKELRANPGTWYEVYRGRTTDIDNRAKFDFLNNWRNRGDIALEVRYPEAGVMVIYLAAPIKDSPKKWWK